MGATLPSHRGCCFTERSSARWMQLCATHHTQHHTGKIWLGDLWNETLAPCFYLLASLMHPRYCHVAADEPSTLTVGETDVYNLPCAWTENVMNPIILWLSKITGNWRRRREHWSTNKATSSVVSGKGGNAMPWFTARSWKLFVFSALWPPGLCHWEPLTVLLPGAIKTESPG